jgi:RNA polymerase sigma factor for flagellar operon FliA
MRPGQCNYKTSNLLSLLHFDNTFRLSHGNSSTTLFHIATPLLVRSSRKIREDRMAPTKIQHDQPSPEKKRQPVKRFDYQASAGIRQQATKAREMIQAVWLEYQANPTCQSLRNQLLEHYLPVVKYNAERLWARLPDGVELDDLISAGIFGLMSAIDAFDLSRGVKFETYCAPRIRGAMLDELRHMDWVPRLVRAKANKLTEATNTLETSLGRAATDQELADYLELTVPELEKMCRDANAVNLVSLNKKKWGNTDGYKELCEVDVVENKRSEDPTRRLKKNDLIRLVTKGLNRSERLILILYYYEELTMKEIGHTLNLSESRVSQMHSSIVRRLQFQLQKREPEFLT